MSLPIKCSKKCKKSVRRISEIVRTDEETAYAMVLMTALLMDLRPDDDEVLEMVLKDCGYGRDLSFA